MCDLTESQNSSKIEFVGTDKANPEQSLDSQKTMDSSVSPTNNRKFHWTWNLRVLISNLYMNTERRLPGARPPACLNNTNECVRKHRCGIPPAAANVRPPPPSWNTPLGQHYATFIHTVEMLILQDVYPGADVLDRLVHMAMFLPTKGLGIPILSYIYTKLMPTTFLFINVFPPCWTVLRCYYLNYLEIEYSSKHEKHSHSKPQKLEVYLNLVEGIISECSDGENETQARWTSESLRFFDFNCLSASVRLARIFDVMDVLVSVLEMEFLSWLDHNRFRQSSEELFQGETKPFVVMVFRMRPEEFLTDVVRQVMNLFSLWAAKSLYGQSLHILRRLICLILEVCNTAEIRHVDNDMIYPNLGPLTENVIAEFFGIFKSHNSKNVSNYLKIIAELNQPYLRFQFIDHFLGLFYYTKDLPFGSEKVFEEFNSRQWLNYSPKAEISKDDELSREDYLYLLLNAIQTYCHWLELTQFCKFLTTKKQIQPLQTISTSPVPQDKIQNDGDMETEMFMKESKVDLPVARIHVATMCGYYGREIRHLLNLKTLLCNEVASLMDVNEWLEFIKDCLNLD